MNSAAPGPCRAARFARSPMQTSRPTREVTGGSPAPSWQDCNSRMRGSEISSYRYWRSISAAARPTDNSMLKTLNGSDSASTSTTDPLPFLNLVTPASRATTLSVEHMSSILGLVTSALAQIPLQDEVIRASGAGKVLGSVCDGCVDRNLNGIIPARWA
jgi:hypothetical protein